MQGVNTVGFAGVPKSVAVDIQWQRFLRCPHKGQNPPAIRHCLFGVNPNTPPHIRVQRKTAQAKCLGGYQSLELKTVGIRQSKLDEK
jgi:hypothetical protein